MRLAKGIVLALALAAFGGSAIAADENDVTAFPEIKAADANKLPLPKGKSQIAIAETDKPLVKLQKARFNTALEEYAMYSAVIDHGGWDQVTVANRNEAKRAIIAAAPDVLSKDPLEVWLVWSVASEKNFEQICTDRVAAGTLRKSDLLTVRRHRIEAEIVLLNRRSHVNHEAAPREMIAKGLVAQQLRQRLEELQTVLTSSFKAVQDSSCSANPCFNYLQVMRDSLSASHGLYGDTADHLKTYDAMFARMKELEALVEARHLADNLEAGVAINTLSQRLMIQKDRATLKAKLEAKE